MARALYLKGSLSRGYKRSRSDTDTLQSYIRRAGVFWNVCFLWNHIHCMDIDCSSGAIA